jgi:uncharacterized protein DUF4034
MPGPQLVTCTNMELMKQVPCPDSALLFHEGRGLVQSAFNAKDFKRLDELYDQWCTGKDRFPDGRWKLSQYGDGLDDNFTQWNTWTKDLTVIQTWQQSRPRSKAALYAEAIYWRAYAWKARGGGYAHSVSKEGWELFRERLAKSKDILAALQAGGSECAAPYAYAGVACRSTDGELYRSLRSKIAGYEHTAEMLDPVDVCDRRHKWTPPRSSPD